MTKTKTTEVQIISEKRMRAKLAEKRKVKSFNRKKPNLRDLKKE